MEVETQIRIAQERGYPEQRESENLLGIAAEVSRILNGLLASLPNRRQALLTSGTALSHLHGP
jgi:hypothetical protein